MTLARPGKIRLDRLLTERELADSREKAQALILAGQVLVDEQKVEKCGALVSGKAALRVLGELMRYVSRGGLKLEGALKHSRLDVTGKICLDLGASTGGFTDCLLQHGAARVFAVVSLEKTNARSLNFDQIGSRVEFVTIDVSFISATLILPSLPPLLESHADVLVLVKPQFEVGKGQVGKGGIVRDPRLRQEAVSKVSRKLLELGFTQLASAESVVPGAEGNREYFLHALWRKPS